MPPVSFDRLCYFTSILNSETVSQRIMFCMAVPNIPVDVQITQTAADNRCPDQLHFSYERMPHTRTHEQTHTQQLSAYILEMMERALLSDMQNSWLRANNGEDG